MRPGWVLVLGWVLAARGGDPTPAAEPQAVRMEIASGVHVDWTHLQLEVVAGARGSGTEDTEAVEQLARRDADAAVRQGARRIPLGGDRTVADLDADPRLGPAVAARMARWEVTEARYHASGKVELVAVLSLQDLLKPYTLSIARSEPDDPDAPAKGTGVLVDARGSGAEPAWVPRLLDPQGGVLFDGVLWEEPAVGQVPAVYVTDPAHPLAAARAGPEPVIVDVVSASGADLTLGEEDASRFRAAFSGSRLLGRGALVVILDP